MVTCFSDSLQNVSTFQLDVCVKCTLKLQAKLLLAKLSAGDPIAQEAKYFARCLVSLYNKVREKKQSEESSFANAANCGVAFAELLSYMEDFRKNNNLVAPVFMLSDLLGQMEALTKRDVFTRLSSETEYLVTLSDMEPHT